MNQSFTDTFSDAQVEKVGNPGKKMKTKGSSDENQTECHDI
jgi:hypothetical protein